jgi:hypothetical protein
MQSPLLTTSAILSLPIEIGGYIWEEIGSKSKETLQALSATCKVFQYPSQRLLFYKLVLSFPFLGGDATEARLSHLCERLGGLRTNRRLLSYIRELEIAPRSDVIWYLTLYPLPISARHALTECVEGMLSVKSLYLKQIVIPSVLAQVIMQALTRQATDLRLERCSFSISPTEVLASERLRVSNLEICIWNNLGCSNGDELHNTQGPFLEKFVSSTRLDIKSLNFNNNSSSNLNIFLNIRFPSVQSFILQTLALPGVYNPSLCLAIHTFLHTHHSITRLKLLGSPRGCGVFRPFHPTCLPHLQELESSAATVQQLVPGRPVESITVYIDDPSPSLPALSVLATSTGVVKELRIFVGKCGATWDGLIGLLERSTPKLQVLDVIHQARQRRIQVCVRSNAALESSLLHPC